MKVLVVDDVGYIRHHVSRMLQSLGHIPVTTDSARQALQILERESSIDVVLTDLLMAELDGLWLFKASQQIVRMTDSGNGKPPAFILMSALRAGNGVDRDVEKLQVAEQIGFVEVLAKPFDAKRLKEVLDRIERSGSKTPSAKALLDRLNRLNVSIRNIIDRHDEELNLEAGQIIDDAMEELLNLSLSASCPA